MTDDRNPYKGWSKVVVTYCSGDIHTGNTTQDWGGSPVKQVGYLNALTVYDYARANFPKLTSLVFAGCSAGSLGMQFWSHKLANSFNLVGTKPVFFADSFMGAFYRRTASTARPQSSSPTHGTCARLGRSQRRCRRSA